MADILTDTVEVKLTRAELDIVCLALVKASENDNECSNVYERLRAKLRSVFPKTLSMEYLSRE